jgi:hypothetical protein
MEFFGFFIIPLSNQKYLFRQTLQLKFVLFIILEIGDISVAFQEFLNYSNLIMHQNFKSGSD